jgi:hypothetical protein
MFFAMVLHSNGLEISGTMHLFPLFCAAPGTEKQETYEDATPYHTKVYNANITCLSDPE